MESGERPVTILTGVSASFDRQTGRRVIVEKQLFAMNANSAAGCAQHRLRSFCRVSINKFDRRFCVRRRRAPTAACATVRESVSRVETSRNERHRSSSRRSRARATVLFWKTLRPRPGPSCNRVSSSASSFAASLPPQSILRRRRLRHYNHYHLQHLYR